MHEHQRHRREPSHGARQRMPNQIEQEYGAKRKDEGDAAGRREQVRPGDVSRGSIEGLVSADVVATVQLLRSPALQPQPEADRVSSDGWVGEHQVMGLPGRAEQLAIDKRRPEVTAGGDPAAFVDREALGHCRLAQRGRGDQQHADDQKPVPDGCPPRRGGRPVGTHAGRRSVDVPPTRDGRIIGVSCRRRDRPGLRRRSVGRAASRGTLLRGGASASDPWPCCFGGTSRAGYGAPEPRRA